MSALCKKDTYVLRAPPPGPARGPWRRTHENTLHLLIWETQVGGPKAEQGKGWAEAGTGMLDCALDKALT